MNMEMIIARAGGEGDTVFSESACKKMLKEFNKKKPGSARWDKKTKSVILTIDSNGIDMEKVRSKLAVSNYECYVDMDTLKLVERYKGR